jgi:signal recognition particle receptor subunit beta
VRETHTTQSSAYFTALLPADVKTKSDRYRSVNDPTLTEASRNTVRYRVYDTPGHGKLRAAQGIAQLRSTSDPKNPKTNARGIIYMLDAANLSENDYLRDTATYLHDILLVLQQRVYKGGSLRNKKIPKTPVLVAANKLDLFTALPVETITEKLETEIERYRQSKRRGLLDASVNPATADEEPEILGTDEGLGRFSFKSLAEEVGVTVEVVGGAVNSEDSTNPAAGIRSWEEWIASCL